VKGCSWWPIVSVWFCFCFGIAAGRKYGGGCENCWCSVPLVASHFQAALPHNSSGISTILSGVSTWLMRIVLRVWFSQPWELCYTKLFGKVATTTKTKCLQSAFPQTFCFLAFERRFRKLPCLQHSKGSSTNSRDWTQSFLT
jgi:hypothetical protein